MVHPVDHVLALPSMVTPLSFDESAGSIELGRDRSGFQGDVKPIQLGVLRFEELVLFLFWYAAVAPEHPVVIWALGQKHGCVPQVLRSDPRLCFPVLLPSFASPLGFPVNGKEPVEVIQPRYIAL